MDSTTINPAGAHAARARLRWLDVYKGMAMAGIVAVHVAEPVFGESHFGNPNKYWPSLADRFDQLRPIAAPIAPIANLIRWFGWLGDFGVPMFVLAAGIGLTVSIGSPRPYWAEVRNRLRRFVPMYLVAFLGLALFALAAGKANPNPGTWKFWAAAVGIRVTPDSLYYGTPSWWYTGFLTQLALLTPALLWLARRASARRDLLIVGAGSLVVRAVGLVLLRSSGYLDAWNRGAVVVTRLPELVAGMLIGLALHRGHRGGAVHRRPPTAALLAGGGALLVTGWLASFTLAGDGPAPAMFAVGSLGVVVGIGRLGWHPRLLIRPLDWLSRHSLAIFLAHHPVIALLLHEGFSVGMLAKMIISVIGALIAAVVLERVTALIRSRARRWASGRRGALAALSVASAVAVLGGCLTAEVVSRHLDPREIGGWGERPSLVPDARFGWTLAPNRTTHLRWTRYDYRIQADAEGFPAPLPAADATRTVLVTGDAFSSGDGVEPDQAWPRVLAASLGPSTAVANFAVTGYGPSQERRVLDAFVPKYHPDVVVLEMFVNDYFDATATDQEFRDGIGFGTRSRSTVGSYLASENLRASWNNLKERAIGRFKSREARTGWGLGGFYALRRESIDRARRDATSADLAAMKATVEAAGARFVVVLVPAAAQVCKPADLHYWPGVSLGDGTFDVDQPQRVAGEIGRQIGLDIHDLRPELSGDRCLFQPDNMHLLPAGQAAVAAAVQRLIG